MPRLLSADSAGQFVVSLDGRVVLGSGPYAGKPLSQVRPARRVCPCQCSSAATGIASHPRCRHSRMAVPCTASCVASRPLLLSVRHRCFASGLP
jgi:hypothetical protein